MIADLSSFAMKPGVSTTGVTSQLASALSNIQGVFSSYGQPFTITSLIDSTHVINSKHYLGQAADIRINNVDPSAIPGIVSTIQNNLGSDYYVQLESDHIHVQYNGVGTPLDNTIASAIDNAVSDASNASASSDGADSSPIDWAMIVLVGIVGIGLVSLVSS